MKLSSNRLTACPRSSDPFYLLSYYIKWVTTSWTYSIIKIGVKWMKLSSNRLTACPRSSDPFYLLSWMAWSNKRVFSRCRVASSLMTQGRPPLLELVSENANNLYINFFNKIRQHFLGMRLITDWGGKIYISQWECSIGKSIYLSYVRERNCVLFAREHWFASEYKRTSLADYKNEHSGYVRYFVR